MKEHEKPHLFYGIALSLAMLVHMVVLAEASLRISWDPNEPAPEGYRIYQRSTGQAYDYSAPIWQGPETSAVIESPPLGMTHFYVVRAYDGDLESVDSDEVSYTTAMVPAPVITHIGEKQ